MSKMANCFKLFGLVSSSKLWAFVLITIRLLYQKRLIVFIIIVFTLYSSAASITAEDSSSDLSDSNSEEYEEEGGSKEDDFAISVLHSAMNNLTTRVSTMNSSNNDKISLSSLNPNNASPSLKPPTTYLLYNTTTFSSPLSNVTNIGTIEDDDFDYGKTKAWKTKDNVQGYEIASDGLQFMTKLLKDKGEVQIRVYVGTPWTVKKEIYRRNLDLLIVTWEGTKRVKVKVPYGFLPQEIKVFEKLKYMDLFAPYGFLELEPEKKIPSPKYLRM